MTEIRPKTQGDLLNFTSHNNYLSAEQLADQIQEQLVDSDLTSVLEQIEKDIQV